MRKNSPQHQTPKAPEKASSPRLTLRFQPIRPKDDRHGGESSKSSSVSSSDPRYQSYCVTMETRETNNSSATALNDLTDAQLNVVSSSKDDEIADKTEDASKVRVETTNFGPQVSSHQIEKTTSENDKNKTMSDNNHHHHYEFDQETNDGEIGDTSRRKRRRESKDSTDSKHSGNGIAAGKSKNKKATTTTNTDSDTESGGPQSDEESVEKLELSMVNNSACHRLSPKVPPLKIVIPTTPIMEPDKDRSSRAISAKQVLPYVVTTSSDSCDTKSENSLANDEKENKDDHRHKDSSGVGTEERYQRVTRSSQRMAAANANANTGHSVMDGNPSSADSHKHSSGDGSSEEQTNAEIHPRKRKLRSREGQSVAIPSSSHQEDLVVVNSYEMYLNVKKQVDRRRQNMFVVPPKPPDNFKEFLMNRNSYVLAGNAASRLCVPMISPPQSLSGVMKELFITQEKERYKLRLQQLIEKEKLILTAEQETLRVHCRAARAQANQSTPLSACTILKDEEIYNQIEPDQEDKDRTVRSRFNGRLFMSWIQDVSDKWEKVKEMMMLRHHNEVESLHAVQKLDWEWKLKDSGTCDTKSIPLIDDISVPMVTVIDDFKLLPENTL